MSEKQTILNDLDEFTRAYLECILWAESDNATPSGGEPLENNYDLGDFSLEALRSAVEDCKQFQADHAADLCRYNHPQYTDAEMGGHDLWLTRNHHGAGFWDRDLPPGVGDRLTKAANWMGSCDVYVGDDGQLHLS